MLNAMEYGIIKYGFLLYQSSYIKNEQMHVISMKPES